MKNAVEKIVKALVGSPDLVEVYEAGEARMYGSKFVSRPTIWAA